IKLSRRLHFPVIVKPLTQQSSGGNSQASVVEDDASLRERVRFIHESVGTDAILEQFIDGRELYVGVIGNERLQVFPIWEMHFSKMPEDLHRIATDRVKWSVKYQERHGIKTSAAKSLPDGLDEQIKRVAKRVYRALEMSGYARMDLRLEPSGKFYVVEANANPQIAQGEDFAESAERAGLSYGDLLQRILNVGLRWQPERPG
ncbi:MAG: ATP-grasp domain-containing protein, partial [Gemmatimonadetes bacterium]|nr:ATP-grasp domain-containing protein [Gemmatimonadota bacterium]